MADEVKAKTRGARRGALAKPRDGPWPAAAVFPGEEFSKRSLPSAYHASRQPSIGLSSRVTSGGRPRLVSLEEINASGLPPRRGSRIGLHFPRSSGGSCGGETPAAPGKKREGGRRAKHGDTP